MSAVTGERLREAAVRIALDVERRMSTVRPETDERASWLEFSTCILSSAVPYEAAIRYAIRIVDSGLLSDRTLADEVMERRISEILVRPIAIGSRSVRYRFFRLRAAQLTAAHRWVRRRYGDLCSFVSSTDVISIRAVLVRDVAGFGPKQSSMFLRNIGRARNMAIIDRHVIAYMHLNHLQPEQATGVRCLRSYEKFEAVFRDHAHQLGFDVDIFDWAVWIVMRASRSLEES